MKNRNVLAGLALGAALVTLAAAGPTADRRQDSESAHEFEQLVDELETCRVPTICSLNGPVYGGGADLALASFCSLFELAMLMDKTTSGFPYIR